MNVIEFSWLWVHSDLQSHAEYAIVLLRNL